MPPKKGIDTAQPVEKAILVSVQTPGVRDEQVMDYIDELAFLARTCGLYIQKRFNQKLPSIHPRSFVGEGKIQEISAYVIEQETDIVVFDDELSPSQIRNLEKILKCKILDRNNLILDIFARHARTAQAHTQVELAQNQYLLPRLTRMWSHLQKQKGGTGMRGPGERELETDRRAIRNRISLLKEKLREIEKNAANQRSGRNDKCRVSLVGYTNAGKSTIMNIISKSDVLAENKLFATLDSTVRKVYLEGVEFLLSDTVGFIRKLPHSLIESFKSTLDEIREADILIHVVDISHPSFEEHIKIVDATLSDIQAANKPRIIVFNKTDLIEHAPHLQGENMLEKLKTSWMSKNFTPVIFITAINKSDQAQLRQFIKIEVQNWKEKM